MDQSPEPEYTQADYFKMSLITLAALVGMTLLFYFTSQSILADHLANDGPNDMGNFYGYGISYTVSFMFGAAAIANALFSLVTAIMLIIARWKRRNSSRVGATKRPK